jgi:hypothetical protein
MNRNNLKLWQSFESHNPSLKLCITDLPVSYAAMPYKPLGQICGESTSVYQLINLQKQKSKKNKKKVKIACPWPKTPIPFRPIPFRPISRPSLPVFGWHIFLGEFRDLLMILFLRNLMRNRFMKELPTIYKAYCSSLCLREYPHKIWPNIWYHMVLTYLHFIVGIQGGNTSELLQPKKYGLNFREDPHNIWFEKCYVFSVPPCLGSWNFSHDLKVEPPKNGGFFKIQKKLGL